MVELKKGQTFEEHAEMAMTPHELEGMVYDCVDGQYMFCQVGYALFVFINLENGNRVFDPVQLRLSTQLELGGCNTRGVLRMMHRRTEGDVLEYVGGGITNFTEG